MNYIVSLYQEINYDPKNEVEEVLANVHMILKVTKEEQPLIRDFSLDSNLIDKNIDVVKNRLVGILLESFKKYEPRAILRDLEFKNLNNNDFNIILTIEVVTD